MDKKELKEKLAELKSQIKANSKDAHYAESLISDLLSVYGQLKHEPTLVHIPLSDIDVSAEGETYQFAITKSGETIYRTTAGYAVIAPSGYAAMRDVVEMGINYLNGVGTEELDEEQNDIIENDIVASTYILTMPTWALSDTEFKYEVAKQAIEYLTRKIHESQEELKTETPDDDNAFKEAVLGMEAVKEAINEELADRKD